MNRNTRGETRCPGLMGSHAHLRRAPSLASHHPYTRYLPFLITYAATRRTVDVLMHQNSDLVTWICAPDLFRLFCYPFFVEKVCAFSAHRLTVTWSGSQHARR